MIKVVEKWFDVQVAASGARVSETFELDKNIVAIKGLLLTSNKDDLLYQRGTQRIEINRDEIFAEGYESKRIMCGINVPPDERTYTLKELKPGNHLVKMEFTDVDDGRTSFSAYRVRLYLLCEMDEDLK